MSFSLFILDLSFLSIVFYGFLKNLFILLGLGSPYRPWRACGGQRTAWWSVGHQVWWQVLPPTNPAHGPKGGHSCYFHSFVFYYFISLNRLRFPFFFFFFPVPLVASEMDIWHFNFWPGFTVKDFLHLSPSLTAFPQALTAVLLKNICNSTIILWLTSYFWVCVLVSNYIPRLSC